MNIAEIRKKYPQYSDVSDADLAKGFHSKFYSDMPYEEFASKIGVGKMYPAGGQNAMGVAKNLGAGLVEGVAAIPTAPRDIGMLAGQGVTYGIDRLRGMTPEQASAEQQRVQQQSQMYEQSMAIPSPLSLIQRGFESYVKPMLPEAKTTAEKYARTIGQFAPAVLAPGSAIQRTANVVVPAVASEAAGQATEGTSAEPVARLVGALAGGRLAAPRTTAISETAKLAPTEAKLAKQVDKAYEDFRSSGAVFDKRAFRFNMRQLKSELADADLDEGAPRVYNKVNRLLSLPPNRITPGLLEKKRSELGKILADPTASGEAKTAATIARQKIMDVIAGAPVQSTTGVTGPELAKSVKKARELAAAKFKAEEVQMGVNIGDWYQSGDISGIRNQLSNLGKSLEKNKNIGWNKIELEALKRAAKGDFTSNFFNVLGKMGFQFGRDSGQQAILPAGLSAAGTVNPALLGAVVAGTAARPVAKMLTRKQVDDLQKVIMAGRTGQAAGISAAERKNAEALIRQLVSSGQATALGLLDEEQ
jgi:hypothetical protein